LIVNLPFFIAGFTITFYLQKIEVKSKEVKKYPSKKSKEFFLSCFLNEEHNYSLASLYMKSKANFKSSIEQ